MRHWPITSSARGNPRAQITIAASRARPRARALRENETMMNAQEIHRAATPRRLWRCVAAMVGTLTFGTLAYWFYPPRADPPVEASPSRQAPQEATAEQVHKF